MRQRFNCRKIITIIYVSAFAIYLAIGLHPVEAHQYEISGSLSIPSIGLTSDVTTLKLENHRLPTPDTIVGSYSKNKNKTLLIGHSATVFQNLERIGISDTLSYNRTKYRVVSTKTLLKSEIDMNEILSREDQNTLVIMTCAGEILNGGDATHRFIVTATEV